MIYIFNESFDIESSYDRYRLHEVVDQMYGLVLVNIDGELEIDEPEYIDVSDLDFDYGDLEAYDFDLSFASVEELLREQKELHNLISAKDVEGLVKYISSLPLEINKEDDVETRELLESGQLEEMVADHISENYDGLYVEHSKSCVASNSFYIKNEDGKTLLKLSDHNTTFQEVKHGTPFINVLGEYGIAPSPEEILNKIDDFLYKEELND